MENDMKTIAICAITLVGLITIGAWRTDTRSAHLRSATSLQVQRVGAMTTERAAQQATLLTNGQVLITGGCGQTGCSPFLASVEIFDPAKRTFRTVAAMSM